MIFLLLGTIGFSQGGWSAATTGRSSTTYRSIRATREIGMLLGMMRMILKLVTIKDTDKDIAWLINPFSSGVDNYLVAGKVIYIALAT
jgi:hypothetical protein